MALLASCMHQQARQDSSSPRKPAEGKAVVTAIKGQAEYSTTPLQLTAEWKPLFDGKTLAGWKATDFAGAGRVGVEKGQLMLHSGAMLTGVTFTNALPKTDYEVAFEAMKIDGSDFFCGLTFPVGTNHCSLIVGGWGGAVVGISSIDGADASENETTKFMTFEKNRWYRVRVRVTQPKIEAWIDDEKLVDQPIGDRKISMRAGEIELSVPFGLAAWQTTSALRNIQIRRAEKK